MRRRQYPILEFDPALPALIEPQKELRPLDVSEHCVITFFGEIIEKLSGEGRLKELVSHLISDFLAAARRVPAASTVPTDIP
jgi:hypothetical protein